MCVYKPVHSGDKNAISQGFLGGIENTSWSYSGYSNASGKTVLQVQFFSKMMSLLYVFW